MRLIFKSFIILSLVLHKPLMASQTFCDDLAILKVDGAPVVSSKELALTKEITKLADKIADQDRAKNFREHSFGILPCLIEQKYETIACLDYFYFYAHLSEKGCKWSWMCSLDEQLRNREGSPHAMMTYLRTFLDFMPATKKTETADMLMGMLNKFCRDLPVGTITPRLFVQMNFSAEERFQIFKKAYELVMDPPKNRKISVWKDLMIRMNQYARGDVSDDTRLAAKPKKITEEEEWAAQQEVIRELLSTSQDDMPFEMPIKISGLFIFNSGE